MKQADIHEGGEYAYRVGYGRRGRCVRAIVTETPVEERNRFDAVISKGTRIETPDDPGKARVVPNRDLVSTWAEYDRRQRGDRIGEKYGRAWREADRTADKQLAAVWDGLMDVLGDEEPRFGREHYRGDRVVFGPEAAVGMAQKLTRHVEAEAYMIQRQIEIKRIVDHRDEAMALAEKQRDEALAALDAEEAA